MGAAAAAKGAAPEAAAAAWGAAPGATAAVSATRGAVLLAQRTHNALARVRSHIIMRPIQ